MGQANDEFYHKAVVNALPVNHPKRYWQCVRKKSYNTRQSANKALAKIPRNDNMHVYECPHCFTFHVGHRPKAPTTREDVT